MQLEVLMEITEEVLIEMARTYCNTKGYSPMSYRIHDNQRCIQIKAEQEHKEWILQFEIGSNTRLMLNGIDVDVTLKDRYGTFIKRSNWKLKKINGMEVSNYEWN